MIRLAALASIALGLGWTGCTSSPAVDLSPEHKENLELESVVDVEASAEVLRQEALHQSELSDPDAFEKNCFVHHVWLYLYPETRGDDTCSPPSKVETPAFPVMQIMVFSRLPQLAYEKANTLCGERKLFVDKTWDKFRREGKVGLYDELIQLAENTLSVSPAPPEEAQRSRDHLTQLRSVFPTKRWLGAFCRNAQFVGSRAPEHHELPIQDLQLDSRTDGRLGPHCEDPDRASLQPLGPLYPSERIDTFGKWLVLISLS